MVDIYSWKSNEMVVQLKLDRASSQSITVNYAVAFESPAPCTQSLWIFRICAMLARHTVR